MPHSSLKTPPLLEFAGVDWFCAFTVFSCVLDRSTGVGRSAVARSGWRKKSVKFMSDPSPEEITTQLERFTADLPRILESRAGLEKLRPETWSHFRAFLHCLQML